MTDIIFQGKVCIAGDANKFVSDFRTLLAKHRSRFDGHINVVQFDDVEIIEEDGKEV